MKLDYSEIGRRIAKRRRELKLTQAAVEERADIGYKYLSSVERGISIPSTEVIMRLAIALDTTPDEFLVGTAIHPDAPWRTVADQPSDLFCENSHRSQMWENASNPLTASGLRYFGVKTTLPTSPSTRPLWRGIPNFSGKSV